MLYRNLPLLLLLSNVSLALTLEDAAHFLRRTEFGPTIERIDTVLNETRTTAVKTLFSKSYQPPDQKSDYRRFISFTLSYEKDVQDLVRQLKQKIISEENFKEKHKKIAENYLKTVIESFPTLSMSHNRQRSSMLKKKKRRIFKEISNYNIQHAFKIASRHFIDIKTLQYWWIQEMLNSPTPFREVMTLFWHDHFATSFVKVRDASLMALQNHTLREKAFEPFGELLKSMSEDLALSLYLDAELNHKDKPNENFARELMELFTLGIGHYTEKDVKSASRALTGFVPLFKNHRSRIFVFDLKVHDNGDKDFLSQKGNFKRQDIINILLKQKQTARYIVHKLWLYFISPTPDEILIKKWAESFYNSDYDTKALLTSLLSSSVFYNSKASLIKSPMDYMIGSAKSFKVNIPHNQINTINRMGQALFAPPDVSGWRGHKQWITTATLPKRKIALQALLSKEADIKSWITWAQTKNHSQPEKILRTVFLALPLTEKSYNKNQSFEKEIKNIMLNSSYHLK